jgi:hypothetical protein
MVGKKLPLFIMALSGILSLPISASGAGEFERATLKGLPGVRVFVEDIQPDAKADGLRREDIQTEVELVLRSSGIKVLTEEEHLKTIGMPYLYVLVGTNKIKMEGSYYSYSFHLDLTQQVTLVRSRMRATATTWSTELVGIVGARDFNRLQQNAADLAKKFANDFLAVNPR